VEKYNIKVIKGVSRKIFREVGGNGKKTDK